MAELSRRSGVSVPTIKFYLREGLLPAGRRTKTNQAFYSDEHVTRLKLIAVLSGTARLSLAEVKNVLAELDGPNNVLEAMATMQDSLVTEGTPEAETHVDEAVQLMDDIVGRRGWIVRPDSAAYRSAVRALAELHTTDLAWTPEMMHEYADHAEQMGALDVATLDVEGPEEDLLVQIVMGTLLRRQLVDSFILLAQQHNARVRYGANVTC
ncbi:MAG: MerR family transcriptional regulator [Corynebacterium sp.]|uniref:MerR family transcriptional regulator n=1 Tax=Corynebacterium sp. TaxID=1720 RepID=UPI0026DF3EBA|nr:MerR family transcriptional regulator [Corynebacterium sp.]MDO5668463.1 MerR family transcriptional regulator [Corynebacterium sp.]